MIENWDLNRIFRPLLAKGASYADIFVEDTEVKSLMLEDNRIERAVGGHDTGVGLRAIKDLRTRYAYTNELEETSTIVLSKEMARMLDGRSGFSKRRWAFPSLPHRLETVQNPRAISVQDEADVLYLANEVARRVDPCIRQVRVVYRAANQRITMATSDGEARREERVSTVFMVHVVAGKGDLIQTAREQTAEARGPELLSRERVEGLAVKASERAVRLLDARPAPSGPMTVVLSSKAGGTMVHEAVGHGLEADLAQEGLSVYSGKIGEQVAAEEISIIDDATIDAKRGSFCYDDEGTPAQRTVLVEHGSLKGYLYDKLTAMKDSTLSTGNGRRESYRFSPIPRMTNIFIAPGESDPKEIISSVNKGLLVLKMGGGQVDTVNGNFVFEVSEGYLLKRGRMSDMVRGATLIGNGPQIIKEIDMVGNDLGFDVGTCGKDGQGVPVSDAQPTMRIPLIIVGGTEEQE
ncbi:MAG: TldD/PmbA family protein [Deltaproteobacteria bacterium]|nr:MAG: TldD/PmbA family protein [Deltaproteobacteria bacterium]